MKLKNTVAVRRGLRFVHMAATYDLEAVMSDEPPRYNAKEYADIKKALNWINQEMDKAAAPTDKEGK